MSIFYWRYASQHGRCFLFCIHSSPTVSCFSTFAFFGYKKSFRLFIMEGVYYLFYHTRTSVSVQSLFSVAQFTWASLYMSAFYNPCFVGAFTAIHDAILHFSFTLVQLPSHEHPHLHATSQSNNFYVDDASTPLFLTSRHSASFTQA